MTDLFEPHPDLIALEAARIGSQLFAFDSATSDQMATPRLFDTFATRLSAQALSNTDLVLASSCSPTWTSRVGSRRQRGLGLAEPSWPLSIWLHQDGQDLEYSRTRTRAAHPFSVAPPASRQMSTMKPG